MQKYEPFQIVQLTKNKILLICKSYEQLEEFYMQLEKKLKKMQFNGIVYFDKLSFKNNVSRFVKIPFENGIFIWKESKSIKGNRIFKKITSDFFYNNQDLLDNTLLSQDDKQRIISGEII